MDYLKQYISCVLNSTPAYVDKNINVMYYDIEENNIKCILYNVEHFKRIKRNAKRDGLFNLTIY